MVTERRHGGGRIGRSGGESRDQPPVWECGLLGKHDYAQRSVPRASSTPHTALWRRCSGGRDGQFGGTTSATAMSSYPRHTLRCRPTLRGGVGPGPVSVSRCRTLRVLPAGIEEVVGQTIPIGGAGLIVAYKHTNAQTVEPAVARAVKKVIGEAEGHHVKALKGALAEARKKLARGGRAARQPVRSCPSHKRIRSAPGRQCQAHRLAVNAPAAGARRGACREARQHG